MWNSWSWARSLNIHHNQDHTGSDHLDLILTYPLQLADEMHCSLNIMCTYHWRWLARILFCWYIIFMIMIITCHSDHCSCVGQFPQARPVTSVLWTVSGYYESVTQHCPGSPSSPSPLTPPSPSWPHYHWSSCAWLTLIEAGRLSVVACNHGTRRSERVKGSEPTELMMAVPAVRHSTSTIITQWHTGGADSQPCKNKGNEKCLTTDNTLWTWGH